MDFSDRYQLVVNHEWLWFGLLLFAGMVVLEYALFLRNRPDHYDTADSRASIIVGGVAFVLILLTKALWLGVFYQLYEHRLFEIGYRWWAWVLLFFADDFTYYWFHRLGHQVSILWAGHSTHHSSRHYHYATALRQAWLEYFYKYAYWLWLPLLGFDPLMVFTMLSISQMYGFLLHTEAVGKLGPLEAVLSTPSHHRVHHGTDPQYIDRNFGGFLIIWDRLFGTFQREQQRPRYGVLNDDQNVHVLSVGLRGYAKVAQQYAAQDSWSGRLQALFGKPGAVAAWQTAPQNDSA